LGRHRRRWEIRLRLKFKIWEGVVGNGWSWLRIGTVGGHFEYGDGPSGSKICEKFLDYLQNHLTSQEGLCSME